MRFCSISIFRFSPGTLAAFTENTSTGVYQVGAVSCPASYTKCIDSKGKTQLKMKPKEELEGTKDVLMSVKYHAATLTFMLK